MLTTEAKPLDHVSALGLCITRLDRLYKAKNMTTPNEALGDYLGLGYDILTGESKMVIFGDYYNNCNVSADGKYILPDFFRAEKIFSGTVDKSTVIYNSLKEYTESSNSDKDGGANGGNKGFALSGTFSSSSQSTKTSMEKKDESMILFKAEILLYRLEGDLSGRFGRAFGERMKSVVNTMKRGLKRTTRYLIEEIYRDYGNHVILQADLGVKLERKVFISSSLVSASSEKASNFKMGVEASMKKEDRNGAGKGGFGSKKTESALFEIYQVDRTDIVSVWGGPDYEKMFSNNLEDLMSTDNVVALSKNIVPLHSVMHIGSLSALGVTESEVSALRMKFQNVYDELIERNTHRGCTDKEYYNFDFQANVDDKTCTASKCKIVNINFDCSMDQNECHVKREEMLNQLSIQEKMAMERMITVPSEDRYNKYLELENQLTNVTKCKGGKTSQNPDAKFFALASMNEFKMCAKQGTIVHNETGFYNKVCGEPVPAEWLKPPVFGGFYQKCELDPGTQKYYAELAKLGKPHELPCERLAVKNIISDKFDCPHLLEPILIKNYIHTLPDTFETIYDGICDYANGHGCETYAFELVLKDKVNISTFWCRNSSIYYGGAYERARPYNSYINAEGCGPGMMDVRIFHDNVFCISNFTTEGRNHSDMPELRSLFSIQSDSAYCKNYASKKLITYIDGEAIYACIYKKRGYNLVSAVQPAEVPFKDFLEMIETHENSILTFYKIGNESEKNTIPLYSINYEIATFIQQTTKKNESKLESNSEVKPSQPQSSVFTTFTSPIIIAIAALTVFALILICLCC
uniref:Macrophage-expressed gene 1 protein n=1 Tax=Panagrellus redivivus TaxID=6233 RepID=A0A7E4UXB2_PANRE